MTRLYLIAIVVAALLGCGLTEREEAACPHPRAAVCAPGCGQQGLRGCLVCEVPR